MNKETTNLKRMVFLWFKPDVSIWDRKRSLADRPLAVQGHNARVILEISLDKRPWSKAQAIFLGMLNTTGLGRDTFDIMWLTNGSRVSVKGTPSGNHITMVQLGDQLTLGRKGW